MTPCVADGPHDKPCEPILDETVCPGYSDGCRCGCDAYGTRCDTYKRFKDAERHEQVFARRQE